MGCLYSKSYSKKNKIIIDTEISANYNTYIEIRSIYIQHSNKEYSINDYHIDFCIICDIFNPNTNLNHHCIDCNKCHYKYKIYCKLCNNCYNPLSEYDIIMHRKKLCI